MSRAPIEACQNHTIPESDTRRCQLDHNSSQIKRLVIVFSTILERNSSSFRRFCLGSLRLNRWALTRPRLSTRVSSSSSGIGTQLTELSNSALEMMFRSHSKWDAFKLALVKHLDFKDSDFAVESFDRRAIFDKLSVSVAECLRDRWIDLT